MVSLYVILEGISCFSVLKGIKYDYWLVVSTPLKNISQLGLLFPIYGKIKPTRLSAIFNKGILGMDHLLA